MSPGFHLRTTNDRKWILRVPEGLPEPYPAILMLHGRGESGTDGWRAMAIGLGRAFFLGSPRWPAAIVFPQKPDRDVLWPEHEDHLNDILHELDHELPLDPARRYITGLSQGGHGVFHLAGRLAWEFAAAAPVCGWAEPEQALANLRGIPTWAFHGDSDQAVPVQGSIEPIKALEADGSPAKLTVLEGVGHNAWDHAYLESELAEWMFRQRRLNR